VTSPFATLRSVPTPGSHKFPRSRRKTGFSRRKRFPASMSARMESS
jgi:hypothetical protein